jgi:hypothetical protein
MVARWRAGESVWLIVSASFAPKGVSLFALVDGFKAINQRVQELSRHALSCFFGSACKIRDWSGWPQGHLAGSGDARLGM